MLDLQNVMDPHTEGALDQVLFELREKARVQIVVATIATTEGVDVMRLATDQGHRWGLGDKNSDMGAFVLIAVADRKYAIAVGYGLEGVLTDQFAGSVGREHFRPRFREGDYSGGIFGGVMALVDRVAQDKGIQVAQATPRPPPRSGGKASPRAGAACILFGLIVGSILLSIIARAGGSAGRRSWRGGRHGSGLLWWLLADALLSGRRGGGGSGWGGGGWGGGGFGGGFGGGGGGFGGGGASGGW